MHAGSVIVILGGWTPCLFEGLIYRGEKEQKNK